MPETLALEASPQQLAPISWVKHASSASVVLSVRNHQIIDDHDFLLRSRRRLEFASDRKTLLGANFWRRRKIYRILLPRGGYLDRIGTAKYVEGKVDLGVPSSDSSPERSPAFDFPQRIDHHRLKRPIPAEAPHGQ